MYTFSSLSYYVKTTTGSSDRNVLYRIFSRWKNSGINFIVINLYIPFPRSKISQCIYTPRCTTQPSCFRDNTYLMYTKYFQCRVRNGKVKSVEVLTLKTCTVNYLIEKLRYSSSVTRSIYLKIEQLRMRQFVKLRAGVSWNAGTRFQWNVFLF